MGNRTCPGLPANWLNAWLAAIGATVVEPNLTLAWTDDPVPLAVLGVPGDDDPAERIRAALPAVADLESCPIARHLTGHPELAWNVDHDTWRDRAELARRSPAGWMLSAVYTDLTWDRTARAHVIGRGQFATPMPGRDNTIHDRLRKLLPEAATADMAASLAGTARRVANNGLGFDVGRVGSLADDTTMTVDPVIELLAFHALALFPVRGDGRSDARQRGWTAGRGQPGGFRWPTWNAPLDAPAIDALLDWGPDQADRLGVTGWWHTMPYGSRGTSDVTRAYGATRTPP